MFERLIEKVRSKTGREFLLETCSEISTDPKVMDEIVSNVVMPYATEFWAGAWKELLLGKDGTQYGTVDITGKVYPETERLMRLNGIDLTNPTWVLTAWTKAGQGLIKDQDGGLVTQYRSLEQAGREIQSFIATKEGFAGEIMLLKDPLNKNICGITAYTVQESEVGATLVQKRFPYQRLLIENKLEEITLEQLIKKLFSQKKLGLFLIFAIQEDERNKGLGSLLFDARLKRMLGLGSQVILGRTIKRAPNQYYGNYLKRGLQPIAYDPQDPDKTIMAAEKEFIKPR